MIIGNINLYPNIDQKKKFKLLAAYEAGYDMEGNPLGIYKKNKNIDISERDEKADKKENQSASNTNNDDGSSSKINNLHIEGFLNLNIATTNDLGFGLGGGIGIGRTIFDINPGKLQIRGDFNYYDMSSDLDGALANGDRAEIERFSIFIGLRWLFHITDNFVIYPELGPELSIDKQKVNVNRTVIPYYLESSETKLRIGAVTGFGLFYDIFRGLTIGANFRYHIIQYQYISLSPTIGYRF